MTITSVEVHRHFVYMNNLMNKILRTVLTKTQLHMKIKFLMGFVFMLSAFAMQAQYVGSTEAIDLLNEEATALKNGTTDVKDLTSDLNMITDNATITGLSSNSSNDISLAKLSNYIYPSVMFETAKQIQLTGDTATGIQNAESLLLGMTSDANRVGVIQSAFVYINDLLTI